MDPSRDIQRRPRITALEPYLDKHGKSMVLDCPCLGRIVLTSTRFDGNIRVLLVSCISKLFLFGSRNPTALGDLATLALDTMFPVCRTISAGFCFHLTFALASSLCCKSEVILVASTLPWCAFALHSNKASIRLLEFPPPPRSNYAHQRYKCLVNHKKPSDYPRVALGPSIKIESYR